MIQNRSPRPRYAFVTGGSSGMSAAMARRLARAGYNLILASDRDMELTLAQVQLQQEFPDITVETFSADLGVSGSATRLYEAVSRRRPRVDVFINECWTGASDFSGSSSLNSQLRAIRINIEALTTLTYRIAEDMSANGSGKIMTIGYMETGLLPVASVYPATCAFIERFSEDLGDRLSATGVTVSYLRAPFIGAGAEREGGEIAELAFDGLMRGDAVVALDGKHRTPVSIPAVGSWEVRKIGTWGAEQTSRGAGEFISP